MASPELAAGFSNPRVQTAIMDITQNPMNIVKYQNEPEVRALGKRKGGGCAGARLVLARCRSAPPHPLPCCHRAPPDHGGAEQGDGGVPAPDVAAAAAIGERTRGRAPGGRVCAGVCARVPVSLAWHRNGCNALAGTDAAELRPSSALRGARRPPAPPAAAARQPDTIFQCSTGQPRSRGGHHDGRPARGLGQLGLVQNTECRPRPTARAWPTQGAQRSAAAPAQCRPASCTRRVHAGASAAACCSSCCLPASSCPAAA